MRLFRGLILVAAVTLLATGCASQTAREIGIDKLSMRQAEKSLNKGIRQYEDGDLKAAQKSMLDALNLGLTFDSDKVLAHKYLAFIYCSSNQEKLCREAFRHAFELDPSFKLAPTEIGNPLWGPVYNGVRAELASLGKIKP